jgi:hypothetical protein
MKGGGRFKACQHFGGDESSQIDEEKIRNNSLGLRYHGKEEFELLVR